MAKFQEKIKAIKLRKQGFSIKKIAKKLRVSPGSVSVWCESVKLTKAQIEQLEKNRRDPFYGNRLKNSEKQRSIKLRKIEKFNKKGVTEIGKLSKRDLFLTGVALYWAEGFKKDSQVGFASLDPSMIVFFLKWLNKCFGYNSKDLIVRVTVNISHKERVREIEQYWSGITGIPIQDFQKPFYQNFKWKKIYDRSEEYFGILRIRVRKSTDFLRLIHGYIDGLRLEAKIE